MTPTEEGDEKHIAIGSLLFSIFVTAGLLSLASSLNSKKGRGYELKL